jgi:hypothetical protein
MIFTSVGSVSEFPENFYARVYNKEADNDCEG